MPEPVDSVEVQANVPRDQLRGSGPGLGHQQTIEGITMVKRQPPRIPSFLCLDRHPFESGLLHCFDQVGWGIELAQGRLDRDLPGRNRTRLDDAPSIFQQSAESGRQAFVGSEPPKQGVGIKE